MKRDMELVRKLLLHIEEQFIYEPLDSTDIVIQGYSMEQIGYHFRIMEQGGLINAIDAGASGDESCYYLIDGITWWGHELLDTIRNDNVWNHTKEILKPLGSVSLDILKSVATLFISSQLNIPK